ncbi:Heterogeneous nuclear ribonucleoprotein 27C isoform 1 [Schistosoma japonicum]|uniref:Heterogeneous nuclear ribonucleoprotein 27C isoform 1 n=4 Tax=Schistosoma japonicum TaxID=6182 RepID=A0A4Z2DUV1_SCHJA|nr:Heterogeneous nuclear ribonucleoprotein 27C [Schistosoma japonicum]TNN20306.1 Heterogeneous nuclear ribonucleoprotein 27C isoform 1 [Schistosoma japonicum]
MSIDPQGNEVGKLFVGGLHQSTTNDSLKLYFSKFGDIEESTVMMDNRTGRSRGFGYVKFKNDESVDWVLRQKTHLIDLKEVDPKRCNVNMKGKNRRSLKVFVGGIAFDHDENIIRNFFSSYGRVTDVNLLAGQTKPRHRGFAFVGFEDEEVVRNLIKLHYLNLNGKQVEIKAMKPPNTQKSDYQVTSNAILSVQGNGRPVRGSQKKQYSTPQSNGSCATWSHWPGNWGSHGQPQAWPTLGWTNANAPHNGQTGVGPGPPLQNIGAALGNWSDHSINSTNGWMSAAWGHQIPAPPTANRINTLNEDSLYNQQSVHKSQSGWDSLCLAPLGTVPGSMHNSLDPLVNSIDSWNHSAAAGLCQLAPPSLSSSLALCAPSVVPGGWNHGNAVSRSLNNQWTGPASSVIPGPRPTNHLATGYINESLSTHQNGASMSAMATAAAIGLGNSPGCPPIPHWTSTGSVDTSNMKLNESLYRTSVGCNISTRGATATPLNHTGLNLSHPGTLGPPNGLISGDWCTLSTNNLVSTRVAASNANFRLPISHMCKR